VSFDVAASELASAIGAWAKGIEHIGSTAVPGLVAKPVLDIMAGVATLHVPKEFFVRVAAIGFEHRPLDTVEGRLFFARGPTALRTHNLSVCEFHSDFWNERVLFRDRLRADLDLAKAYESLKLELARRFPNDRVKYTDAKAEFIETMVKRNASG
jgi:GrpB-like predicted nucleotidyltransferase (UPF0157 family)